MRQPCDRNCPGRSATCHTECDKYRRYAQQQQESYKKRILEFDVNSAKYEAQDRMKRHK